MLDKRLLYKILRYSVQAAITYLMFRNFPNCNLETTQALVATLIILILSIIIEMLLTSQLANDQHNMESMSLLEKFDARQSCSSPSSSSSCGPKNVEAYDGNDGKNDNKDYLAQQPPVSPHNESLSKKCRVVCDVQNKGIENVDRHQSNMPENKAVGVVLGDDGAALTLDTSAQAGTEANDNVNKSNPVPVVDSPPVHIVDNSHSEDQDIEVANEKAIMRETILDEARNDDGSNDSQKSEITDSVTDEKFYWETRHGNLGHDKRHGFNGMFYDEYPFYNRFRNNNLSNLKNTGEYYTDRGSNSEYKQRKEMAKLKYREARVEERSRELDGYDSRFQEVGSKSEKNKNTASRRRIEGTLDDEIPYTDYNHLPIASGYKSHDYEYGYSFLPPEKWFPQPPRPPVCVTEKRCPVNPVYAQGTPMDVKEFHSSRRITPPDLINTDYIDDKLNSGR
jgi:hypothetical protein